MSYASEDISPLSHHDQQQRCEKQLEWLCDQLNHLTQQYEMWRVRQQRAHKSPAFRYILHMRLITVKGLLKLLEEKTQQKAAELMALVALDMAAILEGEDQQRALQQGPE